MYKFWHVFSTVYKYKKYVQMATAIICDVMMFFLNYSTHVTPVSVLPFPNLCTFKKIILLLCFYLFRLTLPLLKTTSIHLQDLTKFFHPTLTLIFFILCSGDITSLFPASFSDCYITALSSAALLHWHPPSPELVLLVQSSHVSNFFFLCVCLVFS